MAGRRISCPLKLTVRKIIRRSWLWLCDTTNGCSLKVLQWLRGRGCPWDERTCHSYSPFDKGRLKFIQWARAHGCPWDKGTCSSAANTGSLDVLQWARANGCPWDEATCEEAASGGCLEVLKWARKHGCPWDERTYRAAASSRDDIFQWVIENGCPSPPNCRIIRSVGIVIGFDRNDGSSSESEES